jgi:hypothetical protein
MKIRITAAFALLLAGCAESPVVSKAKADFQTRHPQARILKAGVSEGDARHAYVNIVYEQSRASAIPPVKEQRIQLGYRLKDGKWILFHESTNPTEFQ